MLFYVGLPMHLSILIKLESYLEVISNLPSIQWFQFMIPSFIILKTVRVGGVIIQSHLFMIILIWDLC